MSDSQNAILTKLGFDTSNLKQALEEAKGAVNSYKLSAAQADSELQAARAQFAQAYTARERQLAQERIAAAQREIQQRISGLAQLDGAEKASSVTRINILRQQVDTQAAYLRGYDSEIQKINQLTTAYQQQAAQVKVAQASQSIVKQAAGSGEGDYRHTLNRVLSGVTPSGAAGIVGGVLGGEALLELPGILKEVVEGFAESVRSAGEFAESMEHVSQKSGIATSELQGFYGLAKVSGTDLDAIVRGSRFLGAAATGQDAVDETGAAVQGSGKKGAATLEALGIKGGDKSVSELLGEVADKFKEMPDGIQKTQAAIALFGRAGQELIPFLDKGSEGLRKFQAELKPFGFDTAQAAAIEEQAKVADLKVELAKKQFFASLSGLSTGIANFMSDLANTINAVTTFDQSKLGYNKSTLFSVLTGGFAARAGNDVRGLITDIAAPGVTAPGLPKDALVTTAGLRDTQRLKDIAADEAARKAAAEALKALTTAFIASTNAFTDSRVKFESITAQGLEKQFGSKQLGQDADIDNLFGQRLEKQAKKLGPSKNGNRDAERAALIEKAGANLKQQAVNLAREEEIVAKRKALNDGIAADQKALNALVPTSISGLSATSTLGGPLVPANPLANPNLRGALDQGAADRIAAQIQGNKALGTGDNAPLLQQELAARKDLQKQLTDQIQALVSTGVSTDDEKTKLTELTKTFTDNQQKIADLNIAVNDALDFSKVIDGLGALSAGIAEFSDHANAAVKAVTRGIDDIQKNAKLFSSIGKGSQTDGEQAIFTGTDANGDDVSASDRIKGAGALAGQVIGGVGQLKQGGASALTGGLSLGSSIGGLFGPEGALIGAGIGAVGGGLAAIFGGSQKKTDKIAKDVQDQVKSITDAISAGTTNLVQGIAQLQAERTQAISQLSGKKGGADQLKQIEDGIDQQVAQLQAQQKQILDKFNQSIGELQAPQGTSGYVNTIAQIAQQLKDAADAGATAAQQTQFLNLSLNQLKQTVGNDLQSAEQNTITLLQKEVDLKQQSADIDSQAAEQSLSVQRGLGLARGATTGQSAAQQLRDIENARQKQQADLSAQQKTVEAQLGQQAQLFGINLAGLTLEQQKAALLNDQLSIQQAITAETVTQIANQQAFYAQLASGKVSLPAGVLPSGLQIPTGSGYSLSSQTGGPAPISIGGNVPITIQYSGPADPKQLADAVRTGLQQIVTQRSSGKS